jgi:cell wall-associated NlpC family hydrolase
VRNERRILTKNASLFVTLLAASVLVGAFGCAPKKIRIYESGLVLQGRDDLIEYAITQLGKPYRSGAKGPQAFDCSGFVYYVYGRFDITLPVTTEGIMGVGFELSRDDIAAGDLALFRIKGDMHVGIMINALEFIHASKSRGVAIDSIDFPYWRQTLSHFRRVL